MQRRRKGHGTLLRLCACLLAIVLCTMPPAAFSEAQNTAADDKTQGDGSIRVFLASLGEPRTLDLQLSAAYHVADSEIVLPAGAKVALSINDNSGKIKLSYAGQNWVLGGEATLLRSTEQASLKIQQALGASAYPADLTIRSVEKKNSYYLEAIALIRVEDYLPGVLSYAIISTAPAEALRAQAVVSRTYTMHAVQSNTDNRYDLVDTGVDQIYRGNPEENEACETAVQDTAGYVLTYNGLLAKAYYCLSNGGQTEAYANAWSGSEYPYLIVQDDPYDMASPTAFAKTTVLEKDLQNGTAPDALKSLLRQKAHSALSEKGYTAAEDEISLLTLDSITLHTPKFSEPSKLYTKADFALTVGTGDAAQDRQEHSLVVTADVFEELEALLDMSLQSNSNELWSVGVQENSILLRAARYGHGVGMSQYGAIEMAKQGSDHKAILDFYYPGCSITRYAPERGEQQEELSAATTPVFTPTPAPVTEAASTPDQTVPTSTPEAVPASEPEATATTITAETPAPQSTAVQVYYTNVTAEDFVNLRKAPNIRAEIVAIANHGEKLRVLDVKDGWALVEMNGVQAYAVCNLLARPYAETEARQEAPAYTPEPTATVSPIPTATLAPETTAVPAPAVTATPAPADVSGNGGTAVAAKVYVKSGTVNFRENPSKSSRVIMRLFSGTPVSVNGISGDFCSVDYLGVPGYIMTEFLRFDETVSLPAIQATPIPTVQPTAAPQPAAVSEQAASPCAQPQQTGLRNARVTTGGGTLNLRIAPNNTAQVIARIPQCAVVQATEYNDTWCTVRYNGLDGYVKKEFLTFGENYAAETINDRMNIALPEYSIGPAVVITPSGSLNLRQTACPYGTVITLIPRGATVEVYTLQDGWALVAYREYVGYVSETYLSIQQNDNQPIVASEAFTPATTEPRTAAEPAAAPEQDRIFPNGYEAAEGVTAVINTAYTKLHLSPDASARVLDVIAQGESLPVLAVGAEWCIVAWHNQTGYVLQSDVEFHMQ